VAGSSRVLVVDDLDQVRTLIRRALAGCGYTVDVAARLADARALHPSGYDAVLVDAHVGQERGIDLIDELRLEDPAAVRRCLVMTGGAVEALPDGVGRLAKPFRLDELIEAVRAMTEQEADSGSAQPPIIHEHLSAHPPSADRPAGPQSADRPGVGPAAPDAQAWQLLGLTRAARARERQELIDFLHDGPIQELAAAAMELELLSRSLTPGQAQAVGAALQRLDAAGGSLRSLIDESWPVAEPESQLNAALKQRAGLLLAAPASVAADEQAADLRPAEAPFIVDVAELMLLAMNPAGQVRAALAVRTGDHLIRVELALTASGDGQLVGEASSVRAALDAVARALGGTAHATLSGQCWLAVLVLRRPSL
jgi:CheY-like chemotaxis protein